MIPLYGQHQNTGAMFGYCRAYARSIGTLLKSFATKPFPVTKLTLFLTMATAVTGCIVAPPRHPGNLCAIFREKDNWYEATKVAEAGWGTPIHVQMAIIAQESGYHEEIMPPRTYLLGFIPWTRPSSAYGYTQALDSTWEWYQHDSGNGNADRDDFDDAADFVAWYVAKSHAMIGISKWDAVSQYLAYHEGQTGFKNETYAGKEWLMEIAYQVGARAKRYQRQLNGCREELEDGWLWF